VRAGATGVATGPVNTKSTNIADTVTGDGMAMCARAGATLVDMEWGFGGTFTTMMKRYKFPAFNVAVGHGARLVNREGERFMERYDPERLERSELPRVVAAFLNEVVEGRGPVSLDLRHCDENFWADLTQVKGENAAGILLSGKVPDPRVQPIPIEPRWNIWSHRCGVKIDLDCATTLPGLFAAGSITKNEVAGTHASAGIPTAFCGVSGYRAGQAAARLAAEPSPTATGEGWGDGTLPRLSQSVVGPLERTEGPTADELFDRLGEIQGNPLRTMILSDSGIREMLDVLADLRSDWDGVRAANSHELVKAHEVRCAIECAQLIYGSALDRTESRESFFRDTNDDEWFCWHNMRLTREGYVFERVPIPRGEELAAVARRRKSPIAAIMDHSYRPEDFD
jgi:succinate dehydrogenase/fumarate reductase flavoprotein subunit